MRAASPTRNRTPVSPAAAATARPKCRRWIRGHVYGHGVPDQVFNQVELRTGRLLLRAPSPADRDGQVVAGRDEQTQRWLPLPRPYTAADAEAFAAHSVELRAEGRGLAWVIDFQGRYAGSIDLKRADWTARSVEVGYLAAPWARGRGVVTEALSAVTDWVLGQGFGRVEVRAAVGNVASQRVAEKAGFRREGVLRRAGYTHGGPVDLIVLSRVADDSPPAAPTADRPSGPPARIRPTALVVLRRAAEILVIRSTQPGGEPFLRLPGGGIEPGERAVQAAVREVREEVGATLVGPRLLGVVEHLFLGGNGVTVHEICFVVSGALAEARFTMSGWSGLVCDTGQPLAWLPETELRAGPIPFHPTAVLELVVAGAAQRRPS